MIVAETPPTNCALLVANKSLSGTRKHAGTYSTSHSLRTYIPSIDVYCFTIFVRELYLHESQSYEELDIWGWWGKLSLYVSLFLDADILLCGASTNDF